MLLSVGTVFAGPAPKSANQNMQIGVIDMTRVMKESPIMKGFQEELNQKGKELTENLESEKTQLNPDEFKQKQKDAYAEFLKFKQGLESKMDANLKDALEKIAQEKNLTVILYKNTVQLGGVDVTSDIIKTLQ